MAVLWVRNAAFWSETFLGFGLVALWIMLRAKRLLRSYELSCSIIQVNRDFSVLGAVCRMSFRWCHICTSLRYFSQPPLAHYSAKLCLGSFRCFDTVVWETGEDCWNSAPLSPDVWTQPGVTLKRRLVQQKLTVIVVVSLMYITAGCTELILPLCSHVLTSYLILCVCFLTACTYFV